MGFFDFFTKEQPPLVEQAFDDVKLMLRNGHEMFAASTARLLDNEILDVDLKALDSEINRSEQDLRRAVLEHLNVEPDRELIFSLKLISIVHEAERIGDLAKTLAKTADLAHRQRMGPLVEPLRDLRDRIMNMFDLAQEGFVSENESLARDLMRDHERNKDEVTRYLKMVADREDITPNEGVVYAMAARMMSRVSSHLANIASTVVCPFDQIRRSPTWSEDEARVTKSK
jgi:phosphate uptake regulator